MCLFGTAFSCNKSTVQVVLILVILDVPLRLQFNSLIKSFNALS